VVCVVLGCVWCCGVCGVVVNVRVPRVRCDIVQAAKPVWAWNYQPTNGSP